MTLEELYKLYGVLYSRDIYSRMDNSDYSNLIGREVWVCEYKPGNKIQGKLSRNIVPTYVRICDRQDEDGDKCNDYSHIYFKPIKGISVLKKNIMPFNTTGGYSSIHIFETKHDCMAMYNQLYLKAFEELKDYIKTCDDELMRRKSSFYTSMEKIQNIKSF